MGEKVMEKNLVEEFRALCSFISESYDPLLGEDDLECVYEKFLNFLLEHPAEREMFVDEIIKILKMYRGAREHEGKLLPITAIAYSMHELKWPEIYEFANIENRDFYSKNMSTLMLEVISAYGDDWESKDFYKRFS